jgi:hypothetical protein
LRNSNIISHRELRGKQEKVRHGLTRVLLVAGVAGNKYGVPGIYVRDIPYGLDEGKK